MVAEKKARRKSPSRKKDPGKRHLLTAEVQTKLIKCVRLGMAYDHGADAAGILRATYTDWRKRGREALVVYEEFGIEAVDPDEYDFLVLMLNILKADGSAVGYWQECIDKAAIKDWRAAAWKSERRKPKHYGPPKQQVEQTTVQVTITADDLATAKQSVAEWEKERFNGSE